MPHSDEAEDHKTGSSSIRGSDVSHKTPFDRTQVPVFFQEDPVRSGNVLTQDGITQIAYHKYKAGEYTHLDNYLNPFWTWCTETLLPMSMAPNLVTTLGGAALLAAYMATWYYIPNFEPRDGESVPSWLLVGNSLALFLYYTLDCMDGKQARRTGSSSPLGQLFDHGIDCFGTLCHLSTSQTFLLMGPTRGNLIGQLGLQMAFFAPQWEEYYTHVLSHAYGKWLGVTEMCYGVALWTLISSLLDNQAFYSQTIQQTLYPILPIALLPNNPKDPDMFVTILNSILSMELKEAVQWAWLGVTISVVFGCVYRVMSHIHTLGHFLMALTKLTSPLIVTYMVLGVTPTEVIQQEARYLSISSGLCICFITLKMIVFSMARMAYGSFQWDILPIVAVLGFVAYEYEHAEERRLKPKGLTFLLQALCLYYVLRILWWTSTAIRQLCERLDVYLFTIKKKKK